MPARFVSVDRDTPMLLPPDLRDWVTEDDLVHFEIHRDRLPIPQSRISSVIEGLPPPFSHSAGQTGSGTSIQTARDRHSGKRTACEEK